ncbi:MAG: hypothetical protein IT427_09260 [Pirellulales bacterium]|nr:hypothetical protein [Pirellulales bacterium]
MSSKRKLCAVVAMTICVGGGLKTPLLAAVAVVSNRVSHSMRFTVAVGGDKDHPSKPTAYSIASTDLVVIPIPRGQTASLATDDKLYELLPDTAYYFGEVPRGGVELARISLSTPPPDQEAVVAAKVVLESSGAAPIALRSPVVTVKIFVDEEEATRPAIWSRRLQGRIADASEILQKYCGIGLEVIETGTWQSDDKNSDFDVAVAEFIHEADLGKAQLAIGFTSQYQTPHGRTHLGGTRGPLQRHILLREWSKHISESEKLELLVHELGHHFGAAHSPERDAVMRPLLADRQSRAKNFIIRFDPLNTLAINLVAEEIRDRGVQHFAGLSLPTKLRLKAIYTDIAKALPDDPAANIYLKRLGLPPPTAE